MTPKCIGNLLQGHRKALLKIDRGIGGIKVMPGFLSNMDSFFANPE